MLKISNYGYRHCCAPFGLPELYSKSCNLYENYLKEKIFGTGSDRFNLHKRLFLCSFIHTDTHSNLPVTIIPPSTTTQTKSKDIFNGPSLEHFIKKKPLVPSRFEAKVSHPYLMPDDLSGHGRKVYFEVHGCQMNVSDTEIAWSILKDNGYKLAQSTQDADVIFLMTCSIREGAEEKIWRKLAQLRSIKLKNKETRKNIKIGVLGCMAERLRAKLIEKQDIVDLVAGPDSYKDLPRLLAVSNDGEKVINVLLSHDETYADVTPVSLTSNNLSAFVSIMRGCDNMCSYCIVPFTRGRERSREINSIVDEVKHLWDQGIKEVTLLGQNVNSYIDSSEGSGLSNGDSSLASGFRTIYKSKRGSRRFADLLDKVSMVNPEMRIRFTSPHPKDFPDEVLHVINERSNICKHLHLPAQCGSSRILDLMRRGYTRDAYLELVDNIRGIIPSVALTSDFICGFCSETDAEFDETITLLESVRYNFCYVFPYSMREKTSAHRNLIDDVPEEVKKERLIRMADTFRNIALQLNREKFGSRELILIEGSSKRSDEDLVGRNDGNTKVIIPDIPLPMPEGNASDKLLRHAQVGDYVEVVVNGCTSQVLKATPVSLSSIGHFYAHAHGS